MDGIGKVDGSRVGGKRNDLAVRRKHQKFARIEVLFERVDKLLRGRKAALPVHYVPYPAEPLVEVAFARLLLLILPVRSNAVFSHLVHFHRADLNFEVLSEIGDDGCMQRLIHVALGGCDIVLYSAGDGLPLLVNYAQNFITFLYLVDDYPYRREVVYLVERQPLVLHLAVD